MNRPWRIAAVIVWASACLFAQPKPTPLPLPQPPAPTPTPPQNPPADPVRIITTSLPGATIGARYSTSLQASNGKTPYVWSLEAGPAGLLLSSTGTLAGTPTGPVGSSTVRFKVTDSNLASSTGSLNLQLNAAPRILPANIPDGRVGSVYAAQFRVEGGTAPGAITLSGNLPNGLRFANGSLTGTPSQAGSFPFTLRSTDDNGAVAEARYSFDIFAPISLNGTLPGSGGVGAAYDGELSVEGGSTPYRWSIESGALPGGVELTAANQRAFFRGTPRAEGTFNFTVLVTDGSQSARKSFSVTIAALLSITTASIPGGTIGQPYSAFLGSRGGVAPLVWSLGGGRLPGGLSLSSGGGVTGTPSGDPGTYGFEAVVTDALRRTARRSFTLAVSPAAEAPPSAEVSPSFLTFSMVEGSGSEQKTAILSTSVRTPVAYDLRVEYQGAAGNWLTVPQRVISSADNSGEVPARVNSSNLAPGTYTAQVLFSGPGADGLSLRVTLAVTPGVRLLTTAPTGLTFSAVEGGSDPPRQQIAIVNRGVGVMSWSATATAIGAASSWLGLSMNGGSTEAGRAPSILDVFATASGLPAGTYYGEIRFSADGAASQTATVVLNVAPRGSAPNPAVTPAGLVFTDGVAQTVTLVNPSPTPVTFFATVSEGNSWLSVSPASGTVVSGRPVILSVAPRLAGLSAGVRRASITVSFAGGSDRIVDVVLVLASNQPAVVSSLEISRGLSPGLLSSESAAPLAAACVPTQLVPVSVLLTGGFNIPAGWPSPVEVRVVDDCGAPLNSGSVSVRFSNGDPALNLLSIGNGRWSGTWTGRNAVTPQVTLTVAANDTEGRLRGTYQATGGIAQNTDPPIVASQGVLNSASYARGEALAPGALVTVFGSRLATTNVQAPTLPLDSTLGVTSVTLGGRQLPLLFASNGQVNALIPFDVPLDVPQGLLVRRGTSLSVPEEVLVTSSQPGVFTKSQSGSGQGIIVDPLYRMVEPGNPAAPGDVVMIFSTGLGAVSPRVTAGTAAPREPLARAQSNVSVTVGGLPAQVVYAGLSPGWAGLYQVNVVIPAGVSPGASVPVVVTSGIRSSPPVTIAVQ